MTYLWYRIYGAICACIALKILSHMGYILCHRSCDISPLPLLWCHNVYVSVPLLNYFLKCAIPCATFPVICILCHISGTICECTPFQLLHFVNDEPHFLSYVSCSIYLVPYVNVLLLSYCNLSMMI
jgi:hypothetical protein